MDFEPDWKLVFERDFCKVCKNKKICPERYVCYDMQTFIEENEDFHHVEDMDDDDTENRP